MGVASQGYEYGAIVEASLGKLDDPEGFRQINVPPSRRGGLWKVISAAIRCPQCGSSSSKALTGKRLNAEGLAEHYRSCSECRLRFRVVQE